MTPIEYYQTKFAADLAFVRGGDPSRGDRLSILVFTGSPTPGAVGAQQQRFGLLDRAVKVRFLFCLHFSVLIDQAIHERARHLHADFDRVAGYPKLAGILASYWTNLHPALLLQAASLYAHPGAVRETDDLTTYVDFFPADYRRFFLLEFPKHTRQLLDPDTRVRAHDDVMEGARAAYTLFQMPNVRVDSFPFVGGPQPDDALYGRWIDLVRRGLRRASA
jgi:hypothetical protein